MADTKLSAKATTTIISGGFLYIIIPDGGGGYYSRKIAAETFENPSSIDQIDQLVNQGASFTKAFDAGSKLLQVDFYYVAGTDVKIKVGTTLGGTEISLAELNVGTDEILPLVPNLPFRASTTVYITISGTGALLNVTFRYINDWF